MAKNIDVGGRLHSIATGNIIAGANEILDDNTNKTQSAINTEVNTDITNLKASVESIENSVGTGGSIDSRITNAVKAESDRAQTVETQLQSAYEALTQSNVVPVAAADWPLATLEENTIYRVEGSTSYSDYMYNGTNIIHMATYDNGIDDNPIVGSENLVKSGGVAEMYGEYINNSEWIRIVTDAENKILCGIKKNGSISWAKGVPEPVKQYIADTLTSKVDKEIGKTLINGEYIQEIENSKYIRVVTDSSNHILFCIKRDGSVDWGKGVPQPIIDYIDKRINDKVDSTYISSEDWIKVTTDNEGRILDGIKPDGSHYIHNIESETILKELSLIDTPTYQNFIEVTTDTEGKILSYREPDGTKVEEKLLINNLVLGDNAKKYVSDLIGGKVNNDWSDQSEIVLPMPDEGAIVNIIIPTEYYNTSKYQTDKINNAKYIDALGRIKKGLAYKKGLDWACELELFDKHGNYFKKPIELNAQGDSSLSYSDLNQGFDITDGSTIKFGNWVSQDSFHLKKYFIDAFRGQSIVAYRLMEQMYQTYPYGERKPWDYINNNDSSFSGLGSVKADFNTGALGHPDGFPISLYVNGELKGVYVWALKKHRDNYFMKKDNKKHILLDGRIGVNELWNGNIDWTAFEIRNPKSLKTIDGGKYDGDNPTEITGDSNVDATTAGVKAYLERFAGSINAVVANPTKETFETYFDVKWLIDYFLIGQVIFHTDGFWKNWIWGTWDGMKWSPTLYDADSIFGQNVNGTRIEKERINSILGTNPGLPTSYLYKDKLYWSETKARYKELRDRDIFSVSNIIELLEKWLENIGYENLKTDLEDNCPETPSYRDNRLNDSYWDETTYVEGSTTPYDPSRTYTTGEMVSLSEHKGETCYIAITDIPQNEAPMIGGTYPVYPFVGGTYNSINRVKNWLKERIEFLDNYFEY